jgi:dephospho-CoA kinase
LAGYAKSPGKTPEIKGFLRRIEFSVARCMTGHMKSNVIRKIGLTGGIASGKSSVSKMLARQLGCVHIDADEICRQLLEPQEEGWQELNRIFGSRYLAADGRINRPLLRKDLFENEKFRKEINTIVHPLVKRRILAQMDHIIGSAGDARVLVEVPLLFEVHWEHLFDVIVVVYAAYEKCLNRLMKRDGIEKAAAVKELESQLPMAEKAMRADHVIDNSGPLPDTNNQVEHLAELLKK